MNVCDDCQKMMIDLIEDELTAAEKKWLLRHLSDCVDCSKEYKRLKKLYGLMDRDGIQLPPQEFFDHVRSTAKQGVTDRRKLSLKQIAKILVPSLAAAAILILILRPSNNAVEWSVPVSSLIEDEDVAYVAMQGIVTEELVKDLILLEDQLPFDPEEEIEGLTVDEKKRLIDVLNQKYAIGT